MRVAGHGGTMTGQQSALGWDQSDWRLQSSIHRGWGEGKEKASWKNTGHSEKQQHSVEVDTFWKFILLFLNFVIHSHSFPPTHNPALQRVVQTRLQNFDTPSIQKWSPSPLTLSLDGLMQPKLYFKQENAVEVMHTTSEASSQKTVTFPPGSLGKVICHMSLTTRSPSCCITHVQVFRSTAPLWSQLASTISHVYVPSWISSPIKPSHDCRPSQHLTATRWEFSSKNLLVETFPNSWPTQSWAK